MYSNATTFRSKPVSFEIANKFVSGFSGVVSIAHFIRNHPLVGSLTATVASVTSRSYNPFNYYDDFDLAVQSVLSVIHGFGAPQVSPNSLPNTMASAMALPPSRFDPWTPVVISPPA